MAGPRIWLLDEPGAGLDRETEEGFWRFLGRVIGEDDILMVSTHRPMLAASLANRVIVLGDGRIQRDGRPESILPGLLSPPQQGVPIRPQGGVNLV